jgi:hypothetical protein
MGSNVDMGKGKVVRVGDHIPHYTIRTIEIRANAAEQKEYNSLHATQVAKLKRYSKRNNINLGDASTDATRFDMRSYRRLCHMSYSPSLERLVKRVSKNLSQDVDRWRELGDHGLTYFLSRVNTDYAFVVSQSASECAQYIANCTPKLRYLSKILLETVVKGKRRPLIFAAWPMVAWHAEMFLHLLDF